MDVLVMKEQLEQVQGQVTQLVNLLGGNQVGPTKTKGVVDLVYELKDALEEMIGKFAHAEKWRLNFKNAQEANAERQEKRRQQAEEREYQAAQEAARHKRELELKDQELAISRRLTRNRTILAAIMGIVGFVAKHLFEYYFQ